MDDFFLFDPKEAKALRDKFWTDITKLLDLGAPMALSDCLGCTVERDEPNKVV